MPQSYGCLFNRVQQFADRKMVVAFGAVSSFQAAGGERVE